jgi:hypothetical protein
MMRRLCVALLLVAGVGAPLRADLKYASRSEMKPSTEIDASPLNPLLAMIGGQLVQQMLPNGPADTMYIVSEKGVRTEYVKGGMNGQAEGTVTLLRDDGDFIVMTPKDKTYWKTSVEALASMMQTSGIQPQVTTKATDDVATIVGVRAKRTTFELRIDLPIPEQARALLPPGMPTSLGMSGEVWAAQSPFDKYLAMVAKNNQALAGALGIGKAMQGGIPMRTIVRSPLFNGQQLETAVTTIGEQSVPASLFEIPADYKEVASPIKSTQLR